MTSNKKYECPHCEQTSSRRWNMKVHIDRAHGTGETYASSGSYQSNAKGGSFNLGASGIKFPSYPIVTTNKKPEASWNWQGSAILDQIYRIALEIEGNRMKINKTREVFGEIPYPFIQRINAEPFRFTSEITSEPQIPPAEIFQTYISPSAEPGTVKDSDVRGPSVSNKTTQEKPESLTFDQYRKIVPELTSEQFVKITPGTTFDQFRKIVPGLGFERYREIRQTSANDWKIAQNEKIRLKRNLFGELV
jgi:hypothetical protein